MLGRWCAAALLAAGASSAAAESFDNVIVGAGAGGLQLAYYMKKSGRDYVILERGAGAGNTFSRLPRHRNLISINKWNTGSGDPEFNLRHDWNSLLDEEPEPFLFPPYSDLLMPKAWSLVEYLEDYAAHHDLRIQYNVEVQKIHREGSGEYTLTVGHTNSTEADFKVSCKNLVMATGLPVTKVPKFRGMELAESYSDVSVDPALFANKSVLIIGRGNAAFELANNLSGVASHLHIIGRSKQRFAWQTHYVGDLRAVNNDVLDLYQLKSQVIMPSLVPPSSLYTNY
jgi:cation diffusion facilitator CzcD-associated flavoprotein CzcO